MDTIVLANGAFPRHPPLLRMLRSSRRIVCCDGAAAKLLRAGLTPALVVGDGDSLSARARRRFGDRLVLDRGQDDNDLAKAVRQCLVRGWRELTILGAVGLREDHMLGNLSLLADFAGQARVRLLTDHGCFTPMLRSGQVTSVPGQPLSIFAFDPWTAITSQGLRYPLKRLRLTRWWQATLNAATGRRVRLAFTGGPLLVYRAWVKEPV